MSGSIQQPPTATMSIAANTGGVYPIGFGYYPQEGSKAVSVQYAWGAGITGYAEDLSQLVARGVQTAIQAVYIDNSQSTGDVALTVNGSGQVIVCPSGYQGVAPIFFTGTPGFAIQTVTDYVTPSTCTGVTRLIFLNVPAQSAGFWPSTVSDQGGATSVLGVTGTTQVKTGAGRVFKVIVNTVTATGTITLQDGIAGGTVILTIPIGAAVGTVFDLQFPFLVGLDVVFNGGATGGLAISYT